MVQERKIALLVDAENVSHHCIGQVMTAVKNNLGGLVTVKRIYADWTKPNLSAWKAELRKHAFLPIQQYSFTSGKNSTDFALVIDAMDLLYQNDIDVFYIVSSDSDFTRLAMRIRESGKMVIGMGENFNAMRFSKKVIVFTMGATIVYAVVYMVLCFSIGQLPDYSFNAGLFAALSAENLCNAWIKVQEHKSGAENAKLEEPQLGDDTDGVMHPNDMEE